MSIRRERKFNLFRTALAMVLILVMAITPASAASMNIVVIKGETEKKILYNLEPGTFVFPDNNHAQVDYVQKAQLFSNGTFVASNDSKKKNLEDCEYTFNEIGDGTYTVKNSKEDIYLNFSLDENKGGGKCVEALSLLRLL